VVNYADLEQSKENIKPMRSGRKASKLREFKERTPEQNSKIIKETREYGEIYHIVLFCSSFVFDSF